MTLYEWDSKDPILKTWEKAFPGAVKKKSDIPADMLEHMRYPEDLFKVQRDMLAAYHVLDPKTFYEGNDKWDVPIDPSSSSRKQPPYRLSVATKTGEAPEFALTSVFVPQKKQNLAAYVSVGADAAKPQSYGKFSLLRLPGQHPGARTRSDRQPVQQRPEGRRPAAPVQAGGREGALRQPADPARRWRAALRAAALHAA